MESEPSSPTSREIAQAVCSDAEQRSRLVAFARAQFGIGPDDAQDLLQETALELLRQRTAVRSPHGFTFRVFQRRCSRFIRMRQAQREVFAAEEPQEQDLGSELSETAERRLTLQRVFETISSSCRKILLAYYIEGRSLKETAQAIPLPYDGVWNTICRCLRRLRSCLET